MNEEIEEDLQDWLEDKARFCLLLRIPPSEYDGLTLAERDAFIKVHNDIVDQSKARR